MAENTRCDHYFQDSKWCLLCGWVPPMADGTPRYRLADVGVVVIEDALKAKLAAKDEEIKAAFMAGNGLTWINGKWFFEPTRYFGDEIEEAFITWLAQCHQEQEKP